MTEATELTRALVLAERETRRKRNPHWRSRPTELDRFRCFAAYAMYTAGATYETIGDVLDVSGPTASEFVMYGEKWWDK